jgi:hypothetical protein
MARKTRGRLSSIQKLPPDIKKELDRCLRDSVMSQKDIREFINEKLEAAGEKIVSRSSFNRYATQMETAGQRLRESRQVAAGWMAEFGEKPTGEVGNLMIELIRTMAFDFTLDTANSGKPVSPKILAQLSLAVQRLETAAEKNTKREKELRQAFAEEAAAAIDEVVGEAGITDKTATTIKRKILGINNDR